MSASSDPLVRITDDTITLLVWRDLSFALVVVILAALSAPFVVYALFGWWLALWCAAIPVGLLWTIYRSTFVRIAFSSGCVSVDGVEYPTYRLKLFELVWDSHDAGLDDAPGQVRVFLREDDGQRILVALMSGAADAGALQELLNERLLHARQ